MGDDLAKARAALDEWRRVMRPGAYIGPAMNAQHAAMVAFLALLERQTPDTPPPAGWGEGSNVR